MKPKFSKRAKAILLILISIILLVSFVYAINTTSSGYKANAGTEISFSDYGNTYYITNGLALAIFVPTKTVAEWNAFIANKPSGVSSCTPVSGVCNSWGSCSFSCPLPSLSKCGSWDVTGTKACTSCTSYCHGGCPSTDNCPGVCGAGCPGGWTCTDPDGFGGQSGTCV